MRVFWLIFVIFEIATGRRFRNLFRRSTVEDLVGPKDLVVMELKQPQQTLLVIERSSGDVSFIRKVGSQVVVLNTVESLVWSLKVEQAIQDGTLRSRRPLGNHIRVEQTKGNKFRIRRINGAVSELSLAYAVVDKDVGPVLSLFLSADKLSKLHLLRSELDEIQAEIEALEKKL